MKTYLLIIFLSFLSFSAFPQSIISTVAGGGDSIGLVGDGRLATSIQLIQPERVAIAKNGDLIIAETVGSRIRKINAFGIISTIAGLDSAGYSGDGGPAKNALISYPTGITVDKYGNIYFSDIENFRIRKIDTNGIISTFVGNGTAGYSGDSGLAVNAQISHLEGLKWDRWGNLFFADTHNNVIRRVDSKGIITTVAGNGTQGFSGDGGPAKDASFYYCSDIAIDDSENIYVADWFNFRIRKIDKKSGIINTIAGNGYSFYSGDFGQKAIDASVEPFALEIDGMGNLIIGECWNHVVRKISDSGIISTIAGNGLEGFSGDGGPAKSSTLYVPCGVAIDTSGNLFIADIANHRIRKVTNAAAPKNKIKNVLISKYQFEAFPNPSKGIINIYSSEFSELKCKAILVDLSGKTIFEKEIQFKNHLSQITPAISPGNYYLNIYCNEEVKTLKICLE